MDVRFSDYAPERWRRLGLALARRRVDLGWPHRDPFAKAAGVGALAASLLSDLEKGRPRNYSMSSFVRVEAQYGLAFGAVLDYLAGTDSVLRADKAAPVRRRERTLRDLGLTARDLDKPVDQVLQNLHGDSGLAEELRSRLAAG